MGSLVLQAVALSAVLGTAGLLLGRYFRVPSLLFFLILGVIAGPSLFNIIHPEAIEHGLSSIVEIGVAIIIFEGGLSLPISGIKVAPVAIRRMLYITLPLTGLGAMVLARMLLNFPWGLAALFGSIIVVTGPTVIGPLLRSVALKHPIENVLRWEAIWGDSIGAVLAGVVLEGLMTPSDTVISLIISFVASMGIGIGIGIVSGVLLGRYLLPWTIRLGDPSLPGIVALTSAVGIFFLSNNLADSSGVVAAALAGMTLARSDMPELADIKHFKDQLTTLLVAFLFVLLSANLDIIAADVYWPPVIVVVFLLTFLVRPLAVFVALAGTNFSLNERLYIGLIGPRGIIAAALASYFGILLKDTYPQLTDTMVMLTFGTIFVSGGFASLAGKPFAKALGVSVEEFKTGIIIVGYGSFSHELASILIRYLEVVIVDSDPFKCSWAKDANFRTFCRSALSDDLYEELLEEGYRRAIVLTPNAALNNLIAKKAQMHLGATRVFTAVESHDEQEGKLKRMAGKGLAFSNIGFNVVEANMQLHRGEARIDLLDLNQIDDALVTPLAYEYNGGIRIVRAGEEPRGKAICFIREIE